METSLSFSLFGCGIDSQLSQDLKLMGDNLRCKFVKRVGTEGLLTVKYKS